MFTSFSKDKKRIDELEKENKSFSSKLTSKIDEISKLQNKISTLKKAFGITNFKLKKIEDTEKKLMDLKKEIKKIEEKKSILEDDKIYKLKAIDGDILVNCGKLKSMNSLYFNEMLEYKDEDEDHEIIVMFEKQLIKSFISKDHNKKAYYVSNETELEPMINFVDFLGINKKVYIKPLNTGLDTLLGCIINVKGVTAVCRICNFGKDFLTCHYKELNIKTETHWDDYTPITKLIEPTYEKITELHVEPSKGEFNIISHDNKLITKEMLMDLFY